MKTVYIKDLLNFTEKQEVPELLGWVRSIRSHATVVFFDVVDSTGTIQVACAKSAYRGNFKMLQTISKESAVKVAGRIHIVNSSTKEIVAEQLEVVAPYSLDLSPSPRSDFAIFSRSFTDHVLQNRSHYLRNPKQAAVLKFKSKFVHELHNYFQENDFTLIEPPVLTEMLLYDDSTAFSFDYMGNETFLSQCCTFQLEAAILAFEKVYSITPSFRSEHSRSDRHLNEYTHLKIEYAWATLEDLRSEAENFLCAIATRMAEVGGKELEELGASIHSGQFQAPFKRITYDEAVKILQEMDGFEYGKSLGKLSLSKLTAKFGNKPIWIDYIPASAEAFPFSLKPDDESLVMASDLVAPHGFGEIGGIAEKITDKEQLLKRMASKGRGTDRDKDRYKSYLELRDSGLPYHGGIGVGVDRLARYLMELPHVKDVLPYPRLFGRRWNP